MKLHLPKINKKELEFIFGECTSKSKKNCPYCKNEELYTIENGKRYKCKECKKKFRDWTNTHLDKHRLKKKDVYNIVWCFINGKTGFECSKTTSLPYQTVFNMYYSIRNSLADITIPKKQLKEFKEFEHTYLKKYKGISNKNTNIYKKEIKWQFKNKNKEEKIKMIISSLLTQAK